MAGASSRYMTGHSSRSIGINGGGPRFGCIGDKNFGRTAGSAGPEEDLVGRQKYLDDDQADDVPLEPDRPLVLHEVEEGADGVAGQRELAVDRLAAFLEVVFVGQPGVQSLEVGAVP